MFALLRKLAVFAPIRPRMRPAILLAAALLGAVSLPAADSPETAAARARDKLSLEPLQPLVGRWKGTGLPKRGSTAGGWTEVAEWSWKFPEDGARLSFTSKDAKYFTAGTMRPGKDQGSYDLLAIRADNGEELIYTGKAVEESWVLTRAEVPKGWPARVTLRFTAEGKRLIVLYEQALGGDRYLRLAELGYTREGSGFGQGATYPECVVTGGFADREVEYKGQKYKVCCEGCRDLFLMDPEKILAEYRERRKAKKPDSE